LKISKTNLTKLIRDELENFKIVKLSVDDMEQLHKTGQIEKDGVFYQYQEPVKESIKISKGHGRGQSWTNYHDDKSNRLQVTKVGNEYTAYFSKAGQKYSKNSVLLRGLSKIDAAKLVKMAKTAGLEKTAKYGKSKYKKYVSEGKKITLGDKGRKFTLDIENEAQMFLHQLKKDNKKITTKNISNYIDAEYKFFNTPKLNQQVFNYMKKNLKSLSEVVNHTMARFLYIPKKDIKKAIKVVKSMPFKLRGKVEVDSKPATKVKGFYRITTEKQLFNAVVEFLATANIGVKTISKGKM